MNSLKKILFLFLLISLFYIPSTFAAMTTNLDATKWNGVVNYFKSHYPNFNKEKIIEICNSYTSSFASNVYYTCSFTLRETTSSSGFSYSGSRWLPQFFIYTYSTDKIFNARFYGTDFYGNYNDNNTLLNAYSYYYRPNGTFLSDVSSSEGSMSYDWFLNNIFANGGWVIYSVVVDSNFTNKYYNFVSGRNFMLNDKLVGPDYNNGVVPFAYLTNVAFGDLFPYSQEPQLNDKGTYNNSNVITYKINDDVVGSNKELKIKFTFLNQLDINANDIEMFKYGSQVLTHHDGLNCENSGLDTICEFNLKYNVYDSIDDKLFFDFKFNNSYNVKVEDNIDSSGVYSNYKDVEFEYKVVNLKELSGGIFYLRNYDNFEYMKDYLDNVEYNFRFTNFIGNGNFIRPTLYGNDIKYKNTYLFEDENGVIKWNFENYSVLNNFGMEFIDYVFDSSLLVENKYSAFVVENPNYLGSADNDNLDLYISYNSSLFNFNKFNYSTLVNNGSTNGYVSSGSDFDFTINGSQQTIIGGVNSGHIVEFDEEIKVQYKVGLQYFRDKIIDMFNFVSEFYNTMPEKFRVAFSLIFVLLIGIALFRLLL